MREDIASCLEVTYTNISFEGAMKLLQLEDRAKLDEIIVTFACFFLRVRFNQSVFEENREWKTHIENIYFKGDSQSDWNSSNVSRITKLLEFSKGIEAIV